MLDQSSQIRDLNEFDDSRSLKDEVQAIFSKAPLDDIILYTVIIHRHRAKNAFLALHDTKLHLVGNGDQPHFYININD
jgi:hypothetical protein